MNPANFEKAQSCHSGPRRRARKVHALVAAAQKRKPLNPSMPQTAALAPNTGC